MSTSEPGITVEEISRPDSPLLPFQQRQYKKLSTYHSRLPFLRSLPLPVILIISLLILVNILIWSACGIVLHFHPALIGTAVLAWTLGLRHALDADHISAIDLTTRRLIATGQRPVTVGMFFSLGHSTIVIVTSIVVAATASAVSKDFDGFSRVGGIIGTSVSAAFLLLLGALNGYILHRHVVQLKCLIAHPPTGAQGAVTADPDSTANIFDSPGGAAGGGTGGGGCLFAVFVRLFRLIDAPWKMYPLGVLFGLGFDTSSEIALLGISSIQAARGTSIWLILLLPVLFTAGMCMLDTADGALMMALYAGAADGRGSGGGDGGLAVGYYGVVLTGVTVVVAVAIGVLQVLNLVASVAEPEGRFWDGVERIGDRYDVIGGAICGTFVVVGALAMVMYGPFKRWVERRRMRLGVGEGNMNSDEGVVLEEGASFASGPATENGVDNGGNQDTCDKKRTRIDVKSVTSDDALAGPSHTQ